MRAALELILDFGRPRRVLLAVLADRGHHELPIAADITGIKIDTERDDRVKVKLTELDGKDQMLLIGAATGAIAGGLIGNYLDKQAAELDAIPGAQVERRDDSILVNFQGEILFDAGSSQLAPGAYSRLRSLSRTLENYPKSQVIIKGHTDSTGAVTYNQRLSEDRADRVRAFLISEGVNPTRITAIGFGTSLPLSTNVTPEGRAQNRRVEIEIRPARDVMRGR